MLVIRLQTDCRTLYWDRLDPIQARCVDPICCPSWRQDILHECRLTTRREMDYSRNLNEFSNWLGTIETRLLVESQLSRNLLRPCYLQVNRPTLSTYCLFACLIWPHLITSRVPCVTLMLMIVCRQSSRKCVLEWQSIGPYWNRPNKGAKE